MRDQTKTAKESVDLFKAEFIDRAIYLAISVLDRNMARVCYYLKEEKEKITLSLAVISFLKFVSLDVDV